MTQAQLPQWTVGSMSYSELSIALSGPTARCARSVELNGLLFTDMRLVKRKGANPENKKGMGGVFWGLFHKSFPLFTSVPQRLL